MSASQIAEDFDKQQMIDGNKKIAVVIASVRSLNWIYNEVLAFPPLM